MRKGSVLEHLIQTLKQEGFTKESACRSLTVIWVLRSIIELTVNSPASKKPKNLKQHAAHNITWSLVDRSKEC